jgi:hypothetical protein
MANYKKWSSTELDFIQNNHTLLSDEALASKLSQMTGQNISTSMVRRQRRKLALKKSRGRPRLVKEVANNITDNTSNIIN